ncbi:MAG: hypothetical protein J5777_03735 [Clostridiales bacterium]|nr:hypothetical protein [Clostridiales bacterium]
METDKKKAVLSPEDGASENIVSMTREEALKYLGLPEDADQAAIENRFWQLSKKYRSMRGDDAEQKMNDLSAAYDIATGTRDQREKAAQERANEKQFLGKTKSEWKNYVSYTWKYYVAGVVVVVVSALLIYNFFFKPREDAGIISIGNFELNQDYYDGITKSLGYKNPSITTYCYVAVNEEGQEADLFTNQAAVAALYSGTHVLVTDSAAAPYFFEYLTDCSSLYETLKQTLPKEKFDKITPVYMSEREYKKLITEFRRSKGYDLSETEEDYSKYSDAKIMTGLKIEDEAMFKKLGYTNYWQKRPASAVFGINVMSRDQDESKSIITAVLEGL